MRTAPAKFLLETEVAVRASPAASVVEADATTDQAAGVEEPFNGQ